MALLQVLLLLYYSGALCLGKPTTRDFEKGSTFSASAWSSAATKANTFIAKLNLTEKASIVTGSSGSCIGNIAAIERLGFPGLCISDGPTAVNRADLVSIFPAGISTAASWDRELMYRRGFALGSEFKDKGAHVGLGPVAGPLGRHPLGGRNWEGFSPDPYLTSIAMSSTIQGMQDAGVQSCSKHFIGNEQETQRTNDVLVDGTNIEAVSANIDDRTLHELYLWPFADSVRAGTTSVMCSYNRMNETYSCENSALLNGILKKELGFQGYVMSDFFATHSGVKSMLAGLDMDMPGSMTQSDIGTGKSFFGSNVVAAVNNGSVPMSRLDDMVQRIMTPYFLLNQDNGYPTVDPSARYVLAAQYQVSLGITPAARDVRRDHASLIRTLGSAGTVLLKNTNSTLPLPPTIKNIAVFGNDAADPTDGLNFPSDLTSSGFDIGTQDVGGGSGSGRHSSLVSPLEAIKTRAATIGARVQYITSNKILAAGDFNSIYPLPEVCLVFVKTYASEGSDRSSFALDWDTDLVINNVATYCHSTIVITHSGGVNTMPWATNPNITAILAAHYPGEQTGHSIVDILFGDVNPSGRLPYTIPKSEADYDIPITNLTNTNTTDPNAWQANFTEGLMIDYRHFDAKNITPLYEFGFGLSYTTFTLSSHLTITKLYNNPLSPHPAPLSTQPGGNPDLWTPLLSLHTTVSNTGSVNGSSVIQLYVSLPQSSVPSGTPLKVLRGFAKVPLRPGEKQDVVFQVLRRDVSFWDVEAQEWRVPRGEVVFSAGFSERDLRAFAGVEVL